VRSVLCGMMTNKFTVTLQHIYGILTNILTYTSDDNVKKARTVQQKRELKERKKEREKKRANSQARSSKAIAV